MTTSMTNKLVLIFFLRDGGRTLNRLLVQVLPKYRIIYMALNFACKFSMILEKVFKKHDLSETPKSNSAIGTE